MESELVNKWERDGFILELYDIGKRQTQYNRSRHLLSYKLWDTGELIFDDDDFGPSPLHRDDSPETVEALLSFLSLQDGDTDDEYFDNYTHEQLEWRDSRAEALDYARFDWAEEQGLEV